MSYKGVLGGDAVKSTTSQKMCNINSLKMKQLDKNSEEITSVSYVFVFGTKLPCVPRLTMALKKIHKPINELIRGKNCTGGFY